MKQAPAITHRLLTGAAALAISVVTGVQAQDDGGDVEEELDRQPTVQETAAPGIVEEVVVQARFRTAATDVVAERIESDVPIDTLDSENISRVGDSDVAQALRRVPGITLAQGKFVYVRGLGERYSNTMLNGAPIPSPDLARNVLPLDIFPTFIVDALVVKKGFSPEMPAVLGGGNLDIRTRQIPEDRVFSIKISTGWNTYSDRNGLSYNGGGSDGIGDDDGTRALPGTIADAIETYQGDFSESNIVDTLRRDGSSPTLEEARALNRQLATALNRDVDIKTKDIAPDVKAEIAGGYRWLFGDDWEFGFLALGSYANNRRNRNRVNRSVASPASDLSRTQRTVHSVNVTGTGNLGLRFTDEHRIGAMSMFLRDTDDDASISLTCRQGEVNDCADDSPAQGRVADIRFEQRELFVNQVWGEHTLGADTLAFVPLPENLHFLRDTTMTWYFSEAEATTDIPNEVRVSSLDSLDAPYGNVIGTSIRSLASAGEFRFSHLDDDVESWGLDIAIPFRAGAWDIELSGGYDHARKARTFERISLAVGSTAPGFESIRAGTPSEVFSDANLTNPEYGFVTLFGVDGFGLESYRASRTTKATYGKFRFLFNDTWRLSGGVRWEDFRQVPLPHDFLGIGGNRIPFPAQPIAAMSMVDDDIYPSVALTYIRPGFWAEEFQLRFGWGKTVARPNLREVSPSTYIDPLSEARARGNPFLVPSHLSNFDVRAEWFWSNGDHITVSGFHKRVADPIQSLQGAATANNIVFSFVNADSAEIYGVELEGLKSLRVLSGLVGEWSEQIYLAGNVMLSDSRLESRPGDPAGIVTRTSMRMTQQSGWVVNMQLGFDSFNGRHGATLAYNGFGDRIFFAGIEGVGNAVERPFHSLDIVYSWFATENLTVKVRVKNLLGQSVRIEQEGVVILEQDVGTTGLLDINWAL